MIRTRFTRTRSQVGLAAFPHRSARRGFPLGSRLLHGLHLSMNSDLAETAHIFSLVAMAYRYSTASDSSIRWGMEQTLLHRTSRHWAANHWVKPMRRTVSRVRTRLW